MAAPPIPVPDLDHKENNPPVVTRVILGGKTTGYSAGETLAKTLLAAPETPRPPEFTVAWHEENTPGYTELLLESAADFRLPAGFLPPEAAFESLWQEIVQARKNLSNTLQTGLSDAKTRELLVAREMNTAIQLVREELTNKKVNQIAGVK